ncbi:hypothetical protein [Deferrisoma sp.]
MNDAKFLTRVLEKGEKVFLSPGRTHPWEDVILGVPVSRAGGRVDRIPAVGPNTWRSMKLRTDVPIPRGPKELFNGFFLANARRLREWLASVATRDELHEFLNGICVEIRRELRKAVEPDRLESYYRIRKPVDLYMEHLVAMATEFSAEDRRRLVPLLFLPIHKEMIKGIPTPQGTVELFDREFLRELGLTKQSAYGHIKTERMYLAFHAEVARKAEAVSELCGRPFHPVYFDLFWNQRYKAQGENLVELNPVR